MHQFALLLEKAAPNGADTIETILTWTCLLSITAFAYMLVFYGIMRNDINLEERMRPRNRARRWYL